MSEADAFLDAIFAAPDDDLPRLVYADWLEERGQQAYAEFIRLCCRLASEVLPAGERTRLRKHRHELWNRVRSENRTAFAEVPLSATDFPRGICKSYVAVPAEVFVNASPHWWPVICPTALTLIDTDGWGEQVARAPYLSRVLAIRISRRRELDHDTGWATVTIPDDSILSALAASRFLANLRRLECQYIAASAPTLVALRDSPLVAQLADLYIEVAFPDGEGAQLEALLDGAGAAIEEFLVEYGHRLTPPPFPKPV